MHFVAGGISLELPIGWEARLRRQEASQPGRPANVVLHAATVPLPANRGDFGSGVVEHLGPNDALVTLLEYDQRDADKVLFASARVPVPRPTDFSPSVLQRTVGQATGAQWFFAVAGRPFALHAVLGSHARRSPGAVRVAELLRGLTIGARS